MVRKPGHDLHRGTIPLFVWMKLYTYYYNAGQNDKRSGLSHSFAHNLKLEQFSMCSEVTRCQDKATVKQNDVPHMQHQYGLCYNSNIFKDFGYFNEA
jgi:hypothetical protein